MTALVLDRVVKRFGDFAAVDGLSFSVPEGGVFGFLGGNGAGKTTSVRMMLDILHPDAGRIEATDTTFFFGFTDDIVIRVKPAGMGARLDIRSKSRVGQNDIGRNAARIHAYVKRLLSS